MKINILYILSFALILSACDTLPDPEMETANTFPVSGEWYVTDYSGPDDTWGPYHIQIYNTSFSQDSVWMDNVGDAGIVLKSRVTSDKRFDITDGPDYAGVVETATISNSKIINGDSIYFDIVLYDEDGAVVDEFYTAGHRWTGLEGE